MANEDGQTPDLPANVTSIPPGAVDLANPVLIALRNFVSQCAINQAVAFVGVALFADGNIITTQQAPGGMIQVLGMYQAGSHIAAAQMAVHQPPQQTV